jgi:2-keto-4-pentenoate hydratase/2-oxohepta-3-ene-1,7-dioic acid hydratase in catechol pathway
LTKFVRYQTSAGVSYGILDGDTIRELEGDLFDHRETGAIRKLAEVKLLVPLTPSKILCVGRNYESHMAGRKNPTRPEMFLKAISSLQNPDDPIILPKGSTNVHYEGELVVVLGKRLKKASKEEAESAIWGLTCGNDACDRDWQHGPDKDMQWWRAKSFDTCGPVGPCIVTGLSPRGLLLRTRLNGFVVQEQSTDDLIFDCPTMLSFVSDYMTLERGDLIFTGTPNITKKMNAGDTVEVEIEHIGVLRNPVVAE